MVDDDGGVEVHHERVDYSQVGHDKEDLYHLVVVVAACAYQVAVGDEVDFYHLVVVEACVH